MIDHTKFAVGARRSWLWGWTAGGMSGGLRAYGAGVQDPV